MPKDTDSLFITANSIDRSEEAEYECPECGSPIGEGELFCKKCGTELDWGTEENSEVQDLAIIQDTQAKHIVESQNLDEYFANKDTDIRVLCPQCNGSIRIGTTECPYCHAELEWDTGDDLLVSFDNPNNQTDDVQIKTRIPVDYGNAKMNYNSIEYGIHKRAARAHVPETYPAPEMEYNSFGEYL